MTACSSVWRTCLPERLPWQFPCSDERGVSGRASWRAGRPPTAPREREVRAKPRDPPSMPVLPLALNEVVVTPKREGRRVHPVVDYGRGLVVSAP